MKMVSFLVLGFALLGLPSLALSETAVYSPTYTAPQCASATSPCDVPDSLIGGRDTLGWGWGPEWGDEPNQPNTLAASPCADGSEGGYHNYGYDNYFGSLDAFQVTDLSGPSFQPGDTVRLDATVWCGQPNSFDSLYVYHADSPSSPSWVYAGAAACRDYGTQLLSVIFNLGVANNLQAIRVAFTEYSLASPCDAGPGNDRDDVVLTVAGDTGDSDSDGLPNWWEEAYSACVNPLVPDADANPDGDAWTNLQEFQNRGNPCVYNECSDGLDNDGDGLIDLADPGCESATDFSEHGDNACDDGLDNDADGLSDWPADPDCLDLTDTAELKPSFAGYAGYILDNNGGRDIYIRDHYAYIVDYSGFKIYDVSNSASPFLMGAYDPDFNKSYPGLSVNGNYAYAGYYYEDNNNGGVDIIDISDPASPTRVSGFDLAIPNSPSLGIYIKGNYAYLANCFAGLQIVNISNPNNPFYVGGYETPGCAFRVYVSGDFAYVADGNSELQIINVANPASPVLAGNYVALGSVNDVWVSGNYAYVANGPEGLQILNVIDPANPILLATYDEVPGIALGVFVHWPFVYLTDIGTKIIYPPYIVETSFYIITRVSNKNSVHR
jgi:hypothetical protein